MNIILIVAMLAGTLLVGCKSDTSDTPEVTIPTKDHVEGVRISWDYSTLRRLSPSDANYSGYARMIPLKDESLYAIYETDGHIHGIRSFDKGETWSQPIAIAYPEEEVGCAVPEILQLKDGTLLASYNMRPSASADPSKHFSIRVKRSTDHGLTWSDHMEIYQAGNEFENGCWEPAQIQLPSGEIQLFIANEGPYTQSSEQEITMFRSHDNGATWSEGEMISFRSGHRDGMPVPLILESGKIVVSIEDNGLNGPEFKPAIIKAESEDWTNAPVRGDDESRVAAFGGDYKIPDAKYAGAPYISQLANGEVILSYQSDEKRTINQWDKADMIVAIGNSEAENFSRKSIPFHILNPDKTCLWNSLAVIDEHTVVALGSTNAYASNMGVWMIKGTILDGTITATRTTQLTLDGVEDEEIWSTSDSLFIGGYGSTSTSIKTVWDQKYLHILADVRDDAIFSKDGISLFIDPNLKSSALPNRGIFSIYLGNDGAVEGKEGRSGKWELTELANIQVFSSITSSGYMLEASIPWQSLETEVSSGKQLGIHAMLHAQSANSSYLEPISGNESDKPFTWSYLILED